MDTAVQPSVFSGFPPNGPGSGAGALDVHDFRRSRMGPLDIYGTSWPKVWLLKVQWVSKCFGVPGLALLVFWYQLA